MHGMMVEQPETRMSDQVSYKVVEGWELSPPLPVIAAQSAMPPSMRA
jgi:hypothetical protein